MQSSFCRIQYDSALSRGWHGLNVDADPHLIKLFRRQRPQDQAVCAVVSNREEKKVFTFAQERTFSTLSPEFEQKWIGANGVARKSEVETVTLNQLFESFNVPNQFELLCIDVEGHDFEVLNSFDLNTHRPYLITIEMHDFKIEAPRENEIFRYLKDNDYYLQSYATMNGYFIDRRRF